MTGLKRLGLSYICTLILPLLAAALVYPLLGWGGAGITSMVLVWLFLGWGAKGVKVEKFEHRAEIGASLLVGILLSALVIIGGQVGIKLGLGSAQEEMTLWAFSLIALVSLSAPWFEERFFRGALAEECEKYMSKAGSAVITSALFALLHYPLTSDSVPLFNLSVLFLFGLLLSCMKEKTNSLAGPIITHLAFNATSLLFIFLSF